MVFNGKLYLSVKKETSRLPKEVVPDGAGLRGNERDGTSVQIEACNWRKRARGEARNGGLDF